ncbi:hypothetical protein CR513_10007, partial [Mucuna pruriens]
MTHATPWYADICNYLVTSTYPRGASQTAKDKLASDAKYYVYSEIRDQVDSPFLSLKVRRRTLQIDEDSLKSR